MQVTWQYETAYTKSDALSIKLCNVHTQWQQLSRTATPAALQCLTFLGCKPYKVEDFKHRGQSHQMTTRQSSRKGTKPKKSSFIVIMLQNYRTHYYYTTTYTDFCLARNTRKNLVSQGPPFATILSLSIILAPSQLNLFYGLVNATQCVLNI